MELFVAFDLWSWSLSLANVSLERQRPLTVKASKTSSDQIEPESYSSARSMARSRMSCTTLNSSPHYDQVANRPRSRVSRAHIGQRKESRQEIFEQRGCLQWRTLPATAGTSSNNEPSPTANQLNTPSDQSIGSK